VTNDPQTFWLQSPDNVSASYPVTVDGGGVLSVTGRWSGTPTLTFAIACAGTTKAANAGTGTYLTATCGAGPASVTVALPQGTQATVSVSITISYPAKTNGGS
jgi:hypothetical protein